MHQIKKLIHEQPIYRHETTKIPTRNIFGDTFIKPDESPITRITHKEQTQHRYYQNLIKKVAEASGYKATIEAQIPEGGRVDILLERNGQTLAVEICSTTDALWEIHNIEKCIKANFSKIYACIEDPNTRHAVMRAVEAMNPKPLNVSIGTPQDLITILQIPEQNQTEKRTKGYRVNVQHRAITTDEAIVKRAIIESIAKGGKKK